MSAPTTLMRSIGLFPAVLIGLGSILGTGVYVSLGLAAGVAGDWTFIAILIAALLALCNGLSSAQLAAVMPISGGTYEYGYRLLGAPLGFTAGWLFLCAKCASATAAGLAAAGMVLVLLGLDPSASAGPLAMLVIALMTLVVAFGMRTSSRTNGVLVTIAILALLLFMLGVLFHAAGSNSWSITISLGDIDAETLAGMKTGEPKASVSSVALAAALIFVAFTGYGRIATLGEEVRSPRSTIPTALVLALGVATLLYLLVTWSMLSVVSPGQYQFLAMESGAPLALLGKALHGSVFGGLIAIGGLCALFAILLNLLLGLSRVVLAMARRGDMPAFFARISRGGDSPTAAVIGVGVVVFILVSFIGLEGAWTFSAMTVLVYYAITNLAALRVEPEQRFVPRPVSIVGLLGCFFLAFFIPWAMWITAIVLLGVGWLWWLIARSLRRGSTQAE